eukprot:gene6814-30786_t
MDAVDRDLASSMQELTKSNTSQAELQSLMPNLYSAYWNVALRIRAGRCYNEFCAGASAGLDAESELMAEYLMGPSGGVWTRAYMDLASGCAHVENTANRLGLDRIVVGHTVQEGGRIQPK